jgi:type II secretory pathway pseudopilin PulG
MFIDMNIRTFNNKGFIGLLEILITTAIIGVLMYFMLKHYSGAPAIDKETKKAMSEQGIDSTNYKTIIDTARTSVQAIQEKEAQRLDEIMDDAANSTH